jgi:hypothetical protein
MHVLPQLQKATKYMFENLTISSNNTHPKAPGMAQVPPSTDGNNTSITRWPVISASLPCKRNDTLITASFTLIVRTGSFSATGLGFRTGHM